jgi:hypothetical protein
LKKIVSLYILFFVLSRINCQQIINEETWLPPILIKTNISINDGLKIGYSIEYHLVYNVLDQQTNLMEYHSFAFGPGFIVNIKNKEVEILFNVDYGYNYSLFGIDWIIFNNNQKKMYIKPRIGVTFGNYFDLGASVYLYKRNKIIDQLELFANLDNVILPVVIYEILNLNIDFGIDDIM